MLKFRISVVILLAGTSLQTYAQLLQGTIQGNVTDTSQAAIAGAKVVAANQQTNATRDTVTNATGVYTLSDLAPGTYTISVSAPGFQSYTRTGTSLSPNSIVRVDVTMSVGQITENVVVQAQAASLQTDRAEVRSEMTTAALENLPVPIGRNYQMLLVTLPGVSPPSNANSFAANPTRSVVFSANGTSSAINQTRIDGTSSTSVIDTTLSSLYSPALEAIQEMNVVTNAFDAELGLAGGAVVNLTIKSGSNAIHGSAFGFHTDQHLKAYAWLADRTQPQPKYIDNQIGGTLGGPIRKDRLFYFISYEGTGYSENVTQVVEVPTAAMKTGNLSASPTPIFDPKSGNPNGTGRTPFFGNIIPADRIDDGIKNLLNLKLWPDPNQPGTGALGLSNNYSKAAGNFARRDQYDAKLNWNINSKLSMFVRWGFLDHWSSTDQIFGDLGGIQISRANTAVGETDGHVFSGTISGTYVASPNLVLDGYYGYNREDVLVQQPRTDENLGWTVLQVPGLQSNLKREGGWPQLLIDGFSLLGAPNTFQPYTFRDPQKKYAGNAHWMKGTHGLAAGIEFAAQDLNEGIALGSGSFASAGSGSFQFSQGATQLNGGPAGNDYNAFASFLLGLPANAGKTYLFPNEIHTREKAFGLYVSDRWQITPKLTFSFGTRWEYFPFPTRVGRGLEIYNFNTNQQAICGIGPNPIDCGIDYRGERRFAPRVGIAYRATNSIVLRAGYGLTNDPTNISNPYRGASGPDTYSQVLNAPNAFSYATTLRQGLPPVTAPNFSSGFLTVPTNANLTTLDQHNLIRGYIQSWNFVMEKQFAGWIGSAGYVATRSTDQLAGLQQNWSAIGTGAAGEVLRQSLGRTASTLLEGTLGTAKYDSLQARIEHRFAAGYQLTASYTYGKALGYTTQVAIPYDYRLNYGPLSSDIRNNMQLSWVGEVPVGKGKRWLQDGALSKIIGGWQISGVLSLYSGTPFTAVSSATSLNAQFSGQFADCFSPHQTGNIYEWYAKSGFGVPTSGRFGTCGTNSLRGPGLLNADMGVDRKWQVKERFEIRLRIESFNVANTPHHTNPGLTSSTDVTSNNNVTSSSFMLATGIRNTGRDGIDERTFRLGLHLVW